MSRYQSMFSALKAKNQAAFIPFVTLGDPSPELSLEIVRALVTSGADALELGIPFSDPLADGPTIQAATVRALNAKTTPQICFEIIAKIRAEFPDLPIGLLMYANLVYANGIENFYQSCAMAGVDSVLIADVPLEMSEPFNAAAEKFGIEVIFIAPPNANTQTVENIAKFGSGYTYLLSRAGVTGAETKAGMPIADLLQNLAQHNTPPPVLGFGISTPEQVKQAVAAGVAGVISGSAVVNIIDANAENPSQLLAQLTDFIQKMKAATC